MKISKFRFSGCDSVVSLKGSWYREIRWVKMLTVVGHKFGTVAIDVLFLFWTCHLPLKNVFPSPLSLAKWISDYFNIKGCGANNDAMTHENSLRQFAAWIMKLADFFLVRAACLLTLRRFGAQINWRAGRSGMIRIANCQSNRLLILLLQEE